MSVTSGARINTNIGALNALNALNNVNRQLGMHQLRLATGKRINFGADDPSGFVISKKMEGSIRAMESALTNIGDAQSVYGVAEGGYQTIADILVQIKEKQTRAVNGAMGDDEKAAIAAEINQLMEEINNIHDQTKFNGQALLSGGSFSANFQVGEESTATFSVAFTATVAVGTGGMLSVAAGSVDKDNIDQLTVDDALKKVNTEIGKIGAAVNRLAVKEENLTTAITNTEAAKSRILDADIAKEQISAIKLQILQQTATAQLAQANMSPQVFLSLF